VVTLLYVIRRRMGGEWFSGYCPERTESHTTAYAKNVGNKQKSTNGDGWG
jgi:hypothetical protein